MEYFNHFFMIGVFIVLAIAIFVSIRTMLNYRVVVSTNDVHIVQRSKGATSYGAGSQFGNTYYNWPSWMPLVGVKTSMLPLAIFPIKLIDYPAYDKGRVPFIVDIMAFFRISDSNVAATRITSYEEVKAQLTGILQSACRSILAGSEIEDILQGRAEFGEKFTKEVDHNLANWGITSVKNIELMDIRDDKESKVIANIMSKKKSLIEKESRVTVAENMRAAQVAEIEATQNVQMRNQAALEQVGIQTATKDQKIGIANQVAAQEIKAQERLTAEKLMDIQQVNNVRAAQIARDVQVVQADQGKQTTIIQAEAARQTSVIQAEAEKQTNIIRAEGSKQSVTTVAEGQLAQAKMNAEGARAQGEAKGAAETAVLMAPVNAQLALAKEIGENDRYQTYLINIRTVEMNENVGKAKALALQAAQIKVISNTGSPMEGVENVMELFTSKGGTQLGSALEAFSQTPAGEALMKKLGVNKNGAIA